MEKAAEGELREDSEEDTAELICGGKENMDSDDGGAKKDRLASHYTMTLNWV